MSIFFGSHYRIKKFSEDELCDGFDFNIIFAGGQMPDRLNVGWIMCVIYLVEKGLQMLLRV